MSTAKNPKSFRLSDEALKNLSVISKSSGVNETAAVEIALAALATGLTSKKSIAEQAVLNAIMSPGTWFPSEPPDLIDKAQVVYGEDVYTVGANGDYQDCENPEEAAKVLVAMWNE